MIVVLTGGTGGAKFVDGLQRVVPADQLTIVVNTGDDHDWWGLRVSPDVDSITYVLSGLLSPERGWGVRNDTFYCLNQMKKLAEETWFSVGDRDLAIHLLRTNLLSQGSTLSQVTHEIARRLGIRQRILPMSDQRVETRIGTPMCELSFEEYFVKRWYQDPVQSVRFAGTSDAEPAPGVMEAIAAAEAVLIAPSNPVTSIGPIIAVPGIREALSRTSAPVVAVSPIIGKAAVSGPAANLMVAQGLEVSIAGVAEAYGDFLDILLAHETDLDTAKTVDAANLQIHCANILMKTVEDRTRVATAALSLVCPQFAGLSVAETI
jgi:LPPG:FO 2-phospho-L-lactate transferase